MPMPVTQRAEKVLLDISRLFTSLQSDAFAIQERTAKKTKAAYEHQVKVLERKPWIEGSGLVGSACLFISPWALEKLHTYLANANAGTVGPTGLLQGLISQALSRVQDEKIRTQLMEWAKQVTGALSASQVDTPKVKSDAELQRLNQQSQELASLISGLQSAIQTHQTALQRLQNNESSAKQAG